jgi:hypothetical protein
MFGLGHSDINHLFFSTKRRFMNQEVIFIPQLI